MTNAPLAASIARRYGIDFAPIRRAHRATWKWTNDGRVWNTGRWGVSVKNTGFDVTCACGWESATGGAIYVRVREAHMRHVEQVVLDLIPAGAEPVSNA